MPQRVPDSRQSFRLAQYSRPSCTNHVKRGGGSYPGEVNCRIDFGHLADLVKQLVAGRMPVGPEEKSHTLVCALLLQFLKLGKSLDL